jgi:hypothetical protein
VDVEGALIMVDDAIASGRGLNTLNELIKVSTSLD